MPTKSPAQARLMRAAAHTAGGYDGVPQKVGKEFAKADKGSAPKKTPQRDGLAKSAQAMSKLFIGG